MSHRRHKSTLKLGAIYFTLSFPPPNFILTLISCTSEKLTLCEIIRYLYISPLFSFRLLNCIWQIVHIIVLQFNTFSRWAFALQKLWQVIAKLLRTTSPAISRSCFNLSRNLLVIYTQFMLNSYAHDVVRCLLGSRVHLIYTRCSKHYAFFHPKYISFFREFRPVPEGFPRRQIFYSRLQLSKENSWIFFDHSYTFARVCTGNFEIIWELIDITGYRDAHGK